MTSDQPFPKDPVAAADILAALKIKDENETMCRYPRCEDPRQVITVTGGRPTAYCQNPKHNAVSNHRARAALKAAAESVSSVATARQETPLAGSGGVESLRNSVVSRIAQLQSDMERYLSALTELSDPDLSAAQIQASLDQANARVAEAQQAISTERSLRLAADLARTAAQAEAQAEREAAELAIQQTEEAEARIQRLREGNEQALTQIQAEHTAKIERLVSEAQYQREEMEHQAREALARAQAATTMAQEEARQADVRAHEALAQAATAERLVSEARASLDRERAEIDRLRKEHAEAIADARTRAEADRSEARIALDRERKEIDRLRTELAAIRKQAEQVIVRADTLAVANDELRGQLVQLQTREQPRHQ
jgi:colicin import membrane protein